MTLRCYQVPTLFPIIVSVSLLVSSCLCSPVSPIHVYIALLCSLSHFQYPQLMPCSLTPYMRLLPCMLCLNLNFDYCFHCLLNLWSPQHHSEFPNSDF